MNITQTISQTELGERLKNARETAKITQADAAAAVPMSRTTLVAIEKGERRVRIEELQALMQKYPTRLIAPAHGAVIDDLDVIMPVMREAHRRAFVG